MDWTLISSCVLGMWAMLFVFGGERRRQLNEVEARKHEADAAAEESAAEKRK
jgi:hypothetical protein